MLFRLAVSAARSVEFLAVGKDLSGYLGLINSSQVCQDESLLDWLVEEFPRRFEVYRYQLTTRSAVDPFTVFETGGDEPTIGCLYLEDFLREKRKCMTPDPGAGGFSCSGAPGSGSS